MLKFAVGETLPLAHRKKPLTRESVESFVESVNHHGHRGEEHPVFTVQVVAYNEGDDLLKCLTAISKQTFRHFEVILVDNGLDTKTKDALKKYRLTHIVTKENYGCSQGRNIGAPYTRGKNIVFVDADGDIPSDYLEKASKIMADEKIVAVRGKVLAKSGNQAMAAHYDQGDEVIPSIITTEGNSVWRTEDFLKVGGYELPLAGGEGVVLCYRMVEIYGYNRDSFIYNPDLILYHDFHSDPEHLKRKTYMQAIIRDSIDKRYPRLTEFTKYYSKFLKNKNRQLNAKLEDVANSQKQRVIEEYAELYDRKMRQRWESPELVKEQETYNFTVVIPHYNLGDLVVEAVKSVMRQSINSVQIIVVDDVSTDPDSLGVLKDLEEHVQVVYQKKNAGVAAARNAGIEHAKADYVLCLDADDTIEPTYLEKAYNLFEMDKKAGIVSTWVQFTGEKDGTWSPPDKIGLPEALVASPIPTASCFRKEAWEQAGGYDDTMRGYEDWNLWISIIKNDWQVRVVPEFNFNYLIRPDGKVNTSNKNIDTLVGRIVENHSDLYEKYYKEVFIRKHKDVTQLRYDKSELESRTFRILIMNSWLGWPLRILKRVIEKLLNFVQTCRETRDFSFCARLLVHNFQVLFYRARRKLLG